MKIIFQNIKNDVLFLMRRAGYGYEGKDEKTGELNFSKRFGVNRYPRFHVYAKKDGDTIIVNLHLDQKQMSYEGATAHSGEYEGELVEREAERIEIIINKAAREEEKGNCGFRQPAVVKKPSFLRRIIGKILDM